MHKDDIFHREMDLELIMKVSKTFFSLANLLKAKNKVDFVYQARLNSSYKEFKSFYFELKNSKIFSGLLGETQLFPKKLEDLKKEKMIYTGVIPADLRWFTAILSDYRKSLGVFVKSRDDFNLQLLLGNYSQCDLILDQINDRFGFSLWLIEARINLLQLSVGLERQKEYTDSIVKRKDVDVLVQYFANNVSKRIEEKLKANVFRTTVIDTSTSVYPSFIFDYRNVEEWGKRKNDLFYFESNGSLIDKYLFVRRLMMQLSLGGFDLDAYKEVISDLSEIAKELNDELFLSTLQLTDKSKDSSLYALKDVSMNFFKALDEYTTGGFRNAREQFRDLIISGVCTYDVIDLYIRSSIRSLDKLDSLESYEALRITAGESLINRAVVNIYNHYCSFDLSKSFEDLEKMVLAFPDIDLFFPLSLILKRDENFFFENVPVLPEVFNSYCYPLNPIRLKFFKNSAFGQNLSDLLESCFKDSTVLKLHSVLNDGTEELAALKDKVPDFRYRLFIARAYFYANEPLESKRLVEPLLNSLDPLSAQEAYDIYIASSLLEINVLEAMVLSVDKYLDSTKKGRKLKLNKIYSKLRTMDRGKRKEARKSICSPILAHLFVENYNEDKDAIRQALEAFFVGNDIADPTTVLQMENVDKDVAAYFLARVCSVQNIKTSRFVTNTKDISILRLRICQKLIEFDSDFQSVLSSEIKKITEDTYLDDILEKFQKSKVYVDVAVVKENCRKKLVDEYTRYIDIKRTMLGDIFIGNEVLSEIMKTAFNSGKKISYSFNGDYFIDRIVKSVAGEYASSDKHSLDGALSGGLRHGTLENQIRGALESCNVLTEQIEKGEYSENIVLLQQFEHMGPEVKSKLHRCFSDFTKDIDDLVRDFWNEKVRIRNDKFQTGFFEFDFLSIEISILDAEITPATSFDEFFDHVIKALQKKTEKSLEKIRDFIRVEFKLQIAEKINSTMEQVASIVGNSNVYLVSPYFAKASTSVQLELDRISDWFHLSTTFELEDTDLDFPFKVVEKIFENMKTRRTISIKSDVTFLGKLKGEHLRSWLEILFILSENVFKYGRHSDDHVEAFVTLAADGPDLILTVENLCKDNSDPSDLRKDVEAIRSVFEDIDDYSGVNLENKSGYKKIKKILTLDIGTSKFEVIPNFDEINNRFQVRMRLPLSKVVKYEGSIN